jgi:predicted Zn-dependent peptidase
LINELPVALAQVTVDDVKAAAAQWLTPNSRAVLDWQPGVAS